LPVNDWSARDIQLGVSAAWTVLAKKLRHEHLAVRRRPIASRLFRTNARRDENDPQPLDYLSDETNQSAAASLTSIWKFTCKPKIARRKR